MLTEQIMFSLDIVGTVIFAVTGAVRGVRLRLDLLGVVVFGCTVGVGGGMLRDVIIGATPVAALRDERYLIACIITGLVVFFISPVVVNFKRIIVFCDAVGLGVFTALGAAKGDAYHLSMIGIILSGVLSAVGGGMIRDVLAREIPAVLTSDFYATASLIGGVLYFYLDQYGVPFFHSFLLVVCVTTGIRMLAVHFKLRLPAARSRLLLRRRRCNHQKGTQ